MAEAVHRPWFGPLNQVDSPDAPRPRVAADWPLMGDILTHRAGWPEHLLRWRQAEGKDAPGTGS